MEAHFCMRVRDCLSIKSRCRVHLEVYDKVCGEDAGSFLGGYHS